VPEIFDSRVNKRCHHYFGTPIRKDAAPLFEFWKQARRRAKLFPNDDSDTWLFIQHGSYQWVRLAAQPDTEEGQILVYRGIQEETTFRYPSFPQDLQSAANRQAWNRYLALQWRMLSDSTGVAERRNLAG
jgi:hypothetical protein